MTSHAHRGCRKATGRSAGEAAAPTVGPLGQSGGGGGGAEVLAPLPPTMALCRAEGHQNSPCKPCHMRWGCLTSSQPNVITPPKRVPNAGCCRRSHWRSVGCFFEGKGGGGGAGVRRRRGRHACEDHPGPSPHTRTTCQRPSPVCTALSPSLPSPGRSPGTGLRHTPRLRARGHGPIGGAYGPPDETALWCVGPALPHGGKWRGITKLQQKATGDGEGPVALAPLQTATVALRQK